MRIGQNFTSQSFPKSTASQAGPVQPVQPVQKVEFPLASNEITVYKPENFKVESFLFPKGMEWNITVDESYLVLWKQTVFEMAFKVKDFLSGGKLRLEVATKCDKKGLKPYTAVASESAEQVNFYPLSNTLNVDLNPDESFGVKFNGRDDLIYAFQFHGMHEQDPSLAEVSLHLTNKLVD